MLFFISSEIQPKTNLKDLPSFFFTLENEWYINGVNMLRLKSERHKIRFSLKLRTMSKQRDFEINRFWSKCGINCRGECACASVYETSTDFIRKPVYEITTVPVVTILFEIKCLIDILIIIFLGLITLFVTSILNWLRST